MDATIKKWTLLVFGVGIVTVGYFWLNPIQTAQVHGASGYVSSKVPPPKPGQKKVVLKNLGMT